MSWIKERLEPKLKEVTEEEANKEVAERKTGDGIFVFKGDDNFKKVVTEMSEKALQPSLASASFLFVGGAASEGKAYRGSEESETFDGKYDDAEALMEWVVKARV
jgi:hypothetical protein